MSRTHGKLHWKDGRPAVFGLNAAPYVTVKAKRLFPRARQDRKGWVVLTDTPEVARDLEWLLSRYPMEMNEPTAARLSAGADRHREREDTVIRILAGDTSRLGKRDPARAARDYQEVAARMILETGRLLLADDVGLGKTMSAILTFLEPDALPAVIVCMTHLPAQLEREINMTTPWLRAHTVTQMKPYDPSRVRGSNGRRPDVLIVPYSKIRTWGEYLKGEVASVVFDEVQELRTGIDSMKYESAQRLADSARYRSGLSATPIYNYGGEIYNVMNVIAPDVLGDPGEFSREWCTTRGGKKVVGDPDALGLYLRDQGVFLRRTREQVGRELPPVTRVIHTVETDRDLIHQAETDLAQFAELILRRDTAKELRFRASGEIDWRLRRATGLAKAPYVADFVRLLLEQEPKVILYGWHRDVYDRWLQRLQPANPVMYTGTETPKQKQKSLDRFMHGDARVLIISLRAGAGLDGLQHTSCKVAVFGELDWSPGITDQCIGRLQRDGQTDPILAYFLLSEEGSDPIVAEVNNVKRNQSEPMLNPGNPGSLLQTTGNNENRIRLLAQHIRDTQK